MPNRTRSGSRVAFAILALLTIGGCGNTSDSTSSNAGSAAAAGSSGKGTIVAAPNPVRAPSTLSTISWDAGEFPTGEVWVSKDGAPETLFAEGPRNSQDA
jgi:hypothetical protein